MQLDRYVSGISLQTTFLSKFSTDWTSKKRFSPKQERFFAFFIIRRFFLQCVGVMASGHDSSSSFPSFLRIQCTHFWVIWIWSRFLNHLHVTNASRAVIYTRFVFFSWVWLRVLSFSIIIKALSSQYVLFQYVWITYWNPPFGHFLSILTSLHAWLSPFCQICMGIFLTVYTHTHIYIYIYAYPCLCSLFSHCSLCPCWFPLFFNKTETSSVIYAV